jgi:hypothetical protein
LVNMQICYVAIHFVPVFRLLLPQTLTLSVILI